MAKEKKDPQKVHALETWQPFWFGRNARTFPAFVLKFRQDLWTQFLRRMAARGKKKKPLTERRLQKMCALKANFSRVVSSQNGMRFVY